MWPYTQLIDLSPASSSEADCKNQIFPTCWRKDLQCPPIVLVMGELPGEVCDCANGPCKDSAPRRARAPPEQPFILEISKLSVGRLRLEGSLEARSQGRK